MEKRSNTPKSLGAFTLACIAVGFISSLWAPAALASGPGDPFNNQDNILNYGESVGALVYAAADNGSPIPPSFTYPGSTSFVVNEPAVFDLVDPTGNDNGSAWGPEMDSVLQLTINFDAAGHLVFAGSSILEQVDLGSGLQTLYSSNTLVGFGVIPSTTDYWFAFQDGPNWWNLIGGFVDPADVKTFSVTVPEPASLSVMGLAIFAFGSRRFARRTQA